MKTVLSGLISHSWRMVTFRHHCRHFPTEYNGIHAVLVVAALAASYLRWSLAGYGVMVIAANFALRFALMASLFNPAYLVVLLLASIGVDLAAAPALALGFEVSSYPLLAWEVVASIVGIYRVRCERRAQVIH